MAGVSSAVARLMPRASVPSISPRGRRVGIGDMFVLPLIYVSSRCSDQRAWVANVVLLDRIGRPTGQHADRLGGAVRGVLRERAAAHHEQIRNVPRLQVFVDDAGRRIAAHHGATDVVRALVARETEMNALVRAAKARTVERPANLDA